MSNNKKIIISLSIIGLLLISIAISYAYFNAKILNNEKESTIVGTAAKLELTFIDGSPEINASDIIPGWNASKTFKVQNTGDKTAFYKLKIKDISNPLVDGGLSYQITSNDGGENISKRLVLSSTRDISLPIEIGVGEEHNYTITTYYNNIDGDQSSDLGKSFSFTIGIESVRELLGKPLHWDNPEENTLLAAIKVNYPKAEAPETIPGQEINVKEESLLAAAQDDYGISYYFRGNVQNNYVLFAGKCWKIVRIDGNGNIKLLLWNNASNCNNQTVPNTAFNGLQDHGAYVGIMYGDINSNEFINASESGAFDNINDSSILRNLKNWYDTTFETSDSTNPYKYTLLLADVIWCNDKSLNTGNGVVNSSTFGFYGRNTNISLVCSNVNTNDVNSISRFTAYKNTDINNINGNGKLKSAIAGTNPVEYKYYKIGLITGDELIFAGIKRNVNNSFIYLRANNNYWTMSPSNFGGIARIYYMGSFGSIGNGINANSSLSLRPAVALIPSTHLTNTPNQDGTIEHPFEIDA